MQDLPDFNMLLELAEKSPEALDELQKELSEGIIENAPLEVRERLRSVAYNLQLRIGRTNTQMEALNVACEVLRYKLLHLKCMVALLNNKLSSDKR